MGRIVKIPFILIAVAGLSACGGSTTSVGPPPTTPIPGGVAGTAGGSTVPLTETGTVTVHNLNGGDTVEMTIGGTPITGLVRDTTYDKGVLKAFIQSEVEPVTSSTLSNREAGHSGVSSTGAMSASVMNTDSSSIEAGGILRGANYARVSAGTMPTTGTGTFTGSYAGGAGSPTVSAFIVTGDVSLTANFGGSIQGSITNRVGQQNIAGAQHVFENITLNAATISGAGVYSGSTTGGEFTPLGAVASQSGTFSGLIGGATGTETAGAVNIQTTYGSGVILTEVGVFIAE